MSFIPPEQFTTKGKVISAASTNATSIKTSAGVVGFLCATNQSGSPRYLKLYDKGSAPAVGTDIPFHVFLLPGNLNGAGTNLPVPGYGIVFSSGIAVAITGGFADSDTTAIAAGDVIVNYDYL